MRSLVPRSSALRAAAWGAVVAGVAVPLVRRRARIPPPVVTAVASAAPFGLAVALPRSRARDVALCCLQMYAYTVTYKMPHDDPEALERRAFVDYPVRVDRVLGLGQLPNVRLQRRFAAPGRIRPHERVLVWTHWVWFLFPHGTVAYMLLRRPERFPRTAAMTYAVFDLGLIGYWGVPTAPPWYASEQGRLGEGGDVAVRRMMLEYGQEFWKGGWGPLYSVLGGNPLAAMPSLHFATSLMAAHLLAEAGPLEGAIGWTYALTLGLALVYLGEHYVVDLLAGTALTEGIRAAAPRVAPALAAAGRAVQALEARARA
ncbi:MAG: phosphatase PAP2 family protein [Solirubrobacterales bacterium]|nr:phosphatase PAP2 family protein [Solirubrobacterales bacterium]